MLAPAPFSTTATWPIPGDGPDLQAIVRSQAIAIKNQAALIDAYQTVLNNAQAIPPATGTASATGSPATTLQVTGVVGIILLGSTVTGTNIPANTTVLAQQSGTPGGNGNYTISQASSISASAVTFTPGGGTMPWPTATDSDDLMLISQDQTGILRNQNALLQQYQTLLNDSATAPPPTGP